MPGVRSRDMDSEIPRVNLDDYRDLAEPTERHADEELYASQLVEITSDGIVPWDEDGTRPPMLLVAHNARQRGMEWGDEYPEGTLTPLLRIEGGYINLPLAAGETVEGDDTLLVPADDGAVRAFDDETDDEGDAIGLPCEDVDNGDSDDITAVATEVFF